jgi:RNA polymerase sigma-70 factor (ECF subfamily)
LSGLWNTRLTLIERAKDPENEQAWQEFESYYHSFIRMVLRKMQLPHNDQEDLAQEVLIKLWQNLRNLQLDQDKAKFRTWLSVVIKNTVLNYLDSDKRREKREDVYRETLPEEAKQDIDAWIEAEWKQHMIDKVLKHLESFFSGQALSIFLMDLEGKSIDEISEQLDIKKNSIYVLRNRVKQRFMKEIKHLRQTLEF